MVERLPGGFRSDTDIRALYEQLQRQKMGEVAAPDRYGAADRGLAMSKLLPLRLSKDPVADQVLRRYGPSYTEGEPMGSNAFPDAMRGQQPPPLPPTLQQQPSWTREAVDPNEFAQWVAKPAGPTFEEGDWM
jgi:hypothetical protein